MKYLYYPGCSLHATAKEYDLSTRAVCAGLGLALEEVPDWNCCGASSAHATNHLLSLALPARVLGLAAGSGLDVVAPCAACYNRLRAAGRALCDPAEGPGVAEAAGLPRPTEAAGVRVLSVLELLVAQRDRLLARVRRPLGLKVAAYYGCLLVRPPGLLGFDAAEHPRSLDRLLEDLGATPVDWPGRIDCCGGGLSIARPDLVRDLCGRLLGWAARAGAEVIATACPLCGLNLEMRRPPRAPALPVLYITELVGLALDLPGAKGWGRYHLVSPAGVTRRAGGGA